MRILVGLITFSEPPPSVELEDRAFVNSRTAAEKRSKNTMRFDFEKPVPVATNPRKVESPRWRTSAAETMERHPPHLGRVRPLDPVECLLESRNSRDRKRPRHHRRMNITREEPLPALYLYHGKRSRREHAFRLRHGGANKRNSGAQTSTHNCTHNKHGKKRASKESESRNTAALSSGPTCCKYQRASAS